jgi:DNA replication protein DnaC
MLPELRQLCEALKLRYMREALEEVLREAQRTKPSYSQLLKDLLSRELEDKRRRTIAQRVKDCGLKDYWALESFPWHIQKTLARQRRAIEELAELDFLERAESVVFIGKPGVGKSGLASAIVLKALYAGRTARAITAQNLFEEFEQSQADRSTKRLIKRLSSVDLLLIDEFGYVQARTTSQVNQLFRLMDNRASRNSTIITSNLGFEEWGSFLGEKALTAALLSRLLQNCQVFPVEGVNLRDPAYKLPARAPKPPLTSSP